MSDAATLIVRHRGRGVLVDANLLVLWLVGLVNQDRITSFKRTQNFTVTDFRLLKNLIGWFGAPIVTTPHILSQVSDLTDLKGNDLMAIRRLFKAMVEGQTNEMYDTAADIVTDPLFLRLGLCDAAVTAICKRKIVLLTADVNLQLAVEDAGHDAVNFNHVRPLGWGHFSVMG